MPVPTNPNGRESYGILDGKWVTFRAKGTTGRRLIRKPGDEGYVDSFETIPVVDFTNLDHPDIEVRRKLANELATAASECGFWSAINTPISQELAVTCLAQPQL
jgi:hypothetical protein